MASRLVFVALLALVVVASAMRGDNHPARAFQGSRSSLPLSLRMDPKAMAEKYREVDVKLDDSVSLTAYPTSISDNEDVIISWANVATPNATDFIAVSCGPQAFAGDWLEVMTVPNGEFGSGSIQFEMLVMMRCNYNFVYVNNVDQSSTIIANLTVPMRESFNAPKQGHIALTSNQDEMMVMYVSGSQATPPSVEYGTERGVYTETATGSSWTYNASMMCEYPSSYVSQGYFRDPGFIHAVLLTGLKPNTYYYYRYGNSVDGWSDERMFKSRPLPNQIGAKFLAFADMGIEAAPAQTSTVMRILEEADINGFDSFLLHFGDISYARGQGWVWDSWFTFLEPSATRVPYMISPGNHEYDHLSGGQNDPSGAPNNGFHPSWGNLGDDSSGECAVPIYQRYRMPDNGNSVFWYSFNYGGVHIIQMSTEHNWTRSSEQYEWIKNDLAAVNRTQTPWVIITGHRMMYTTQLQEEGDYVVSEHFKEEMDTLLYENKVNLMLVGHQHSYERSCPVYQKQCVPDGKATTHIIVGTAGAGLETGGFSTFYGNWSLVHNQTIYGYCRLTATEELLHVDFVENETGEIFDEVDLLPWT